MTNTQMITLIATILASQFGTLYYLSGRIDRVGDSLTNAINQLGLKVDRLIETVHDINVRVVKLEEKKAS